MPTKSCDLGEIVLDWALNYIFWETVYHSYLIVVLGYIWKGATSPENRQIQHLEQARPTLGANKANAFGSPEEEVS